MLLTQHFTVFNLLIPKEAPGLFNQGVEHIAPLMAEKS